MKNKQITVGNTNNKLRNMYSNDMFWRYEPK